jgi:acyl dehydratase
MTAVEPEVGMTVPGFERTIDLATMVAYAGATWDWNRLHYDHEFLADRGIPRPVVDGQMFGALLAEQAMDWLGGAAFPAHMAFRFRSMVFAGETVRVEGTVADVDHETATVTIDQQVLVGDRVAVTGTTTVRWKDGAS